MVERALKIDKPICHVWASNYKTDPGIEPMWVKNTAECGILILKVSLRANGRRIEIKEGLTWLTQFFIKHCLR